MYKCFICGGDGVYIMDQHNAMDIGYEEPGIVQYMTCKRCRSDYEIFIPLDLEEPEETVEVSEG